MGKYFELSVCFFAVCLGVWLFQDALSDTLLDQDSIKRSAINQLVLNVGTKEPCITQVHVSTWKVLNQLEVYKWVVACEEKLK